MRKRVWHVRLTVEANDPEIERDRNHPYYEDQEMPVQLREWMDNALSDRSDSPHITWSEFNRCDRPDCTGDGVVDGIRPHRPMTEEQADFQRRMYENLPIDTGEINIIRGTG